MTFNVEDTVWFIDNTAPGSLNLGTQDNPFTSIAAFNAVNDGVGNHPAAGDIVYLRAGTYTEADGINLLNNQTLIGQGENLVVNHSLGGNITLETGSVGQTAVIIVTGGSNQGIQLAQGNTISGLDVGMNNATAVGIADGGGTVGNLTISNVGVGVGSNLGSAVDIDQGGTLNVTLKSLSSSGSAGQGVQLAANGAALTGTFSATAASIEQLRPAPRSRSAPATPAPPAPVASPRSATAASSPAPVPYARWRSRTARRARARSTCPATSPRPPAPPAASSLTTTWRLGGTSRSPARPTRSPAPPRPNSATTDQTGGTVTFSSALAVTTTSGTGVNLANNTGGTINFAGGGNAHEGR